MPATASFDITSTIDFQEVDNALNQARDEAIVVHADSPYRTVADLRGKTIALAPGAGVAVHDRASEIHRRARGEAAHRRAHAPTFTCEPAISVAR